METQTDFNKRRNRGLIILLINEAIALGSLYYLKYNNTAWIRYTLIGYAILSTILLINRTLKNKPKDDSNYIFGATIGNKMNTTPQKFIYEVMMMSLTFIILTGIASSVYSIFFTEIPQVYKIIIGISGIFGALFMLMILISTFQQYKQLKMAQDIMSIQEVADNDKQLKGGKDIKKWLQKK